MKFTKMQGLGNDYLYVFGEVPENIKELSIKLSNRYFGPGADGMIYICHSDVADYMMRIFNADGSEAMMCGNGIRCVGKYVHDKGYTDKEVLKIETQSGIKTLYLKFGEDGEDAASEVAASADDVEGRKAGGRKTVTGVTVDMGKGEVGEAGTVSVDLGKSTPKIFEDAAADSGTVSVDLGKSTTEIFEDAAADSGMVSEGTGNARGGASASLRYIPVSMGNPHAVIFAKDMDEVDLAHIGPQVEHHPNFPGGVNTEFVQVLSATELRMRVWERGSGITMACGTGTCASVMAAVSKGYCPYDTPVTVHLDGGDLVIEIKKDNTIYMTGPAEFVYEGDTEIVK